MRVLFLTLYPNSVASARYRVAQYVPWLQSQSFECLVQPAVTEAQYATLTGPGRRGRAGWYHVVEWRRRIAQILNTGEYDIVFVQKALSTAYLRGMWGLLRRRAKKIVYDIDDAVHIMPPVTLKLPWSLLEDRGQVTGLMESANLVLAGNTWLANEARRYGSRVETFPTVVDTDRFSVREREPETFRVGWMGSPGTTPALGLVAEALTACDCEVVLVGADPRQVPIPRTSFRAWSLEREIEELHSFSVGIMPLIKDELTRGKCALKALLYMACGVPCVATPFGAVTEIIEHEVNGLFADTPEEWRAAIERLRDRKLRKRLSIAARATVLERYSLATCAPRLRDLLESVR